MKAEIVSGSATFVIDGSFYPDKSHLLSAHWGCSSNEVLLASGNFISTVKLQYQNACTAELCGNLVVVQFIT